MREVDGHDMRQLMTALQDVLGVDDKLQVIIAHTRKGRGPSPLARPGVAQVVGT
ncbi:MAG: hypothetical protein R6X34_07005 [Chloroflexota bacterium]